MKLLAPFFPYIAGALLLALVTTSVGWRIEAGRLTTRTQERDKAQLQVTQLTAAVTGKEDTIKALQASVESWKQLATPAISMNAAVERVNAAALQITQRASAIKPAEVKDREDPNCTAILAMDLARACPGYAAGVRKRASTSLSGSAGPDPSPGR